MEKGSYQGEGRCGSWHGPSGSVTVGTPTTQCGRSREHLSCRSCSRMALEIRSSVRVSVAGNHTTINNKRLVNVM